MENNTANTTAKASTTAPVSFPKGGVLVSTAHWEWATRPADEKFATVVDMALALSERGKNTKEVFRKFADLRAEARGAEVVLASPKGYAKLNHHSFGQLASLAGLPASGLRASFEAFQSTPEAAKWVADGLNLGLKGRSAEASETANVLLTHKDGEWTARSINTEAYSRVWDLDLVRQLLIPLGEHGFVNPPAYDGPGGLYSGDRDMFALMTPKNVRRINMPGVTCDVCREPFEVNGQLFSPFMFVQNSEVGGSSLVFSSGLVQAVCANLNLWGVEGLSEVRIAHKGQPMNKLMEAFRGFMNKWVRSSNKQDEERIYAAMTTFLPGGKVEKIQETVRKTADVSKKVAEAATALIEKGDLSTGIISQDPSNLWNLVAAITAEARSLRNQDDQMALVGKAGRLMALAVN